jgi:hypothetical protein
MPMICSSVNFDLFMVRSSHWAGLQYQMEELSGVRPQVTTYGPLDFRGGSDDFAESPERPEHGRMPWRSGG